MSETVRKTPNGLHVTYDDGRNVHVAELRECPWCGVATTRVWRNKTTLAKTGEDVTRDLAIEEAVNLWNERSGE